MWHREIEVSEYESVRLKDIFDALQCSLMKDELEEFAYELLNVLGKESPVLEPFDYEKDV